MYNNLLILLVPVVFSACKGENARDKELSMVAQKQSARANPMKLPFLRSIFKGYQSGNKNNPIQTPNPTKPWKKLKLNSSGR
jgi:hypothetical protein